MPAQVGSIVCEFLPLCPEVKVEFQMKTLPNPSKPVCSSDSFHQHLHTYALAAGAAGVGMLALAQPGRAEIIYTPADQTIAPGASPYYLDLTGDGTTDFTLSAFITGNGFGYSGSLTVEPAQGNAVAAAADGAAALLSGHEIGPKTKFGGSPLMARGRINSSTHSRGRCYGPWKNKQDRYLGLKFMISGEVHYGWAELSVTACFNHDSYLNEVLTGYAYETIPNKGLKAGQETGTLDDSATGSAGPSPITGQAAPPATLGTLAKGAPALGIWRQE